MITFYAAGLHQHFHPTSDLPFDFQKTLQSLNAESLSHFGGYLLIQDLPSLSGAQANGGQDPAQDPAPAPCLYVLSLPHQVHPWVKMGTLSTELKS